MLDIVGLCGSVRAQSFNLSALQLAGRSLPISAQFSVLDWQSIPPFSADVLEQGMPVSVSKLSERIRQSDAVIIATPEYNFSIPGMFKNALDWVSRDQAQPFKDKPVVILSATTGPLGGARVQYELRKVLQCLEANVLMKPEIFIGHAGQKFDSAGACTDETTRSFVTAQMQALVKLILRGT